MSSSQPSPVHDRASTRWVLACLAIFFVAGSLLGSWLSRLPALRDQLGASALDMGVITFIMAIGALTGLITAGHTVEALTPKRSILIWMIVASSMLPVTIWVLWTHHFILGAIPLLIFGFAFSTIDVAMNVSGAQAERVASKPWMPTFHAGFSLGTMIMLGVGAFAEYVNISLPLHILVVALILAPCGVLATLWIPRTEHPAAPDHTTSQLKQTAKHNPWKSLRVFVLGVIALTMMLSEGNASDWLQLALVDEHGLQNASAAIVLGVFFTAEMATRIAGTWIITAWGRVNVLRVSIVCAAVGVALVIFSPTAGLAIIGSVLWGAGCALGFPITVSAAADNPATATRDVAAVSTLAYGAFLAGPALVGPIGQLTNLRVAFIPLLLLIVLIFPLVGYARPKPHATTQMN